MAIDVKEQWKRERADDDQETAVRVFDVTGTKRVDRALRASGGGEKIPQRGERHPYYPDRVCTGPKISERPGPTHWIISANYIVPQGGESLTDDDPMEQPPKIQWRFGNTQEEIDVDIHGNPILLSNRRKKQPNVRRTFTKNILIVTRNEPFFDVRQSIRFSNTVNRGLFTVQGQMIAQPGQAKCMTIQPDRAYKPNAPFVTVSYSFELREDGFKTRFIDEGFYKLDSNGEESQMFDDDGEPLRRPAPLNGQGGKLGEGGGIGQSPIGAEVERTDHAIFLRYEVYPERDFSGLGL